MKAPKIEVFVENENGASPITDWAEVRVPESPVSFGDDAFASLVLDGPDGVSLANALMGRTIRVHRQGEQVFRGLVKRRLRTGRSDQGYRVDLRVVNHARRTLERYPCDTYEFKEGASPPRGRDSVRVMPHRHKVFRIPGSDLNDDGEEKPLEGVNKSTVVKRLLGVGFTHQIDFRDNQWILPSQAAGHFPNDRLLVYTDEDKGDLRASLQRARSTPTQWRQGTQETQLIPLRSGDPDVVPQKGIKSVRVRLIGEFVEGNFDPEIRVARGGDAPATGFSAVGLTRTEDFMGSGLDLWEGEVSFASAPDDLSAVHVRIRNEGGIGTEPTRIYYLRVDAETDPALGAEPGVIDEYVSPLPEDPATDWVDDDYTGLNRAEGLARVQESAVTGDLVDNPLWDLWITYEGKVNFRERRGVDRPEVKYSLEEAGLRVIENEEYGDRVAYQTVALGSGRGPSQVGVVDRRPFDEGGLYSPDLDPNGSTRRFGDLPIVAVFEDTSIASRPELRSRARAAHKAWSQLRSYVRAEFGYDPSRLFFTGDRVFLDDPLAGFSGLVRVVGLQRDLTPDGAERLGVEFGETLPEVSEATRSQRESASRAATKAAVEAATAGITGPGVFFDKDTPAAIPFAVPEDVEVNRVFLKIRTMPWIANARGAEAADAGTGLNRGHRIYDREVNLDIDFGNESWTLTQDSRRAGDPNLDAIFVTIPMITDGNFVGFLTVVRVWNLSGSSGNYRYRLRNMETGQILFERGAFLQGSQFVTEIDFWDDSRGSIHDAIAVEIIEGTVGTNFNDPSYDLEVNIFSVATHRHDLEFGLFRFDGDGGDGTGNPRYAREAMFSVDPHVNEQGTPVNFEGQRYPLQFGREDKPVGLLVDVTAHLDTLPDGRIRPGEHFVYFKGTPHDQNEQGLGVASAIALFRFSEDVSG